MADANANPPEAPDQLEGANDSGEFDLDKPLETEEIRSAYKSQLLASLEESKDLNDPHEIYEQLQAVRLELEKNPYIASNKGEALRQALQIAFDEALNELLAKYNFNGDANRARRNSFREAVFEEIKRDRELRALIGIGASRKFDQGFNDPEMLDVFNRVCNTYDLKDTERIYSGDPSKKYKGALRQIVESMSHKGEFAAEERAAERARLLDKVLAKNVRDNMSKVPDYFVGAQALDAGLEMAADFGLWWSASIKNVLEAVAGVDTSEFVRIGMNAVRQKIGRIFAGDRGGEIFVKKGYYTNPRYLWSRMIRGDLKKRAIHVFTGLFGPVPAISGMSKEHFKGVEKAEKKMKAAAERVANRMKRTAKKT